MKKLKSILVVFNGSDMNNGTLKQAIRLANEGSCEVSVAILLPSYQGNLVLVGVKTIKEAIAGSRVKALSDTVLGTVDVAEEEGTEIQTILEGTNIPEAIIDAAKERSCDLIIIGRRGHKKNERPFMESVTARVIGSSPIDVLVIPKDTVIRWDRILLATDGSTCSEVAAAKAMDMARNFNSSLQVVSVVNIPDEAHGEAPHAMEKLVFRAHDIVNAVRDKAEAQGITAETFIREGEPYEKIVNMADHVDADVICMGTYGRTGLRRILMGSVTEKVIRKSARPVLVVKAC